MNSCGAVYLLSMKVHLHPSVLFLIRDFKIVLATAVCVVGEFFVFLRMSIFALFLPDKYQNKRVQVKNWGKAIFL